MPYADGYRGDLPGGDGPPLHNEAAFELGHDWERHADRAYSAVTKMMLCNDRQQRADYRDALRRINAEMRRVGL